MAANVSSSRSTAFSSSVTSPASLHAEDRSESQVAAAIGVPRGTIHVPKAALPSPTVEAMPGALSANRPENAATIWRQCDGMRCDSACQSRKDAWV